MSTKESSGRLSREERNFAEQVRKLRELRGWSQEELARRMRTDDLDHVNQTTVSRIENKTRPVRLMEAQTLSMIFGQTLHAMTNPDSKDFWLSIVELNDRSGRRAYVKFKDALLETAEAQLQAEDDITQLLNLYSSGLEVSPDTEAKFRNVLLNRTNFAQMNLLEVAQKIVEGVRERGLSTSPPDLRSEPPKSSALGSLLGSMADRAMRRTDPLDFDLIGTERVEQENHRVNDALTDG